MADQLKQIKEFPQKPDFGDDDLLLIQGQGTTYNVRGQAVKKYAEESAKPQVELAKKEAQDAAAAADRAEDAIQHPAIPDSNTGNWLVWDQVSESYQQTEPPVRAEGQDFEIRGYYPTLESLEAAVPEPEKGYAYGVGTEAPYDIYVWDLVHGVWVNNGPMTASGDMMRSTYDTHNKRQDIFDYAKNIGLPSGGTTGQIPVKKTGADYDVEWQNPAEGVGRSMAGKTVYPEKDTPVVAAEGAEIFNDYRERTFGSSSNAVAAGNVASKKYAHAEGSSTTASGSFSHAEGSDTKAKGSWSHAEGYKTIASELCSHSEGGNTEAAGGYSHAEGYGTIACENTVYSCTHAEGYNTEAAGMCSHAEGNKTKAVGKYSHAAGSGTISHDYQTVVGRYNVDQSDSLSLFIVGAGWSSERKNCFRATATGVYASGSYNSSGADYAENFEWLDGNPEAVDRVGRFVTLEGTKIRLAGPEDDYIIGIVSGSPSIVGDVYDDQWQGMYLTDIFGRPIWEDVEVPDITETFPDPEKPEDMISRVIVPAHTERRQKLNQNYDNAQLPYIPRSERPEWDAVGMLGKLVAVDDGTCVPNGWAAVGKGGAATRSAKRTKFRVMERLDETHVRLLIL